MITLHNISAGYNGVDVLHNISYALPKGRNLAILGPNGCGKTTLLRVIAGLLPAKGDAFICGLNSLKAPRATMAKKVALMEQMPFATFGYTVREAVMMGRYAHKERSLFAYSTSKDYEICEECLCAVGLQDLQHKSITELSGGQLQRVFLARTLCQQPQIILLDEPTNHMDLKHQSDLIEYLNIWSSHDDHAVVGVLHDLTLAMQFADDAILLKEGQIVASGDIKYIMTPQTLKDVYDMDLSTYMVKNLRCWEAIENR